MKTLLSILILSIVAIAQTTPAPAPVVPNPNPSANVATNAGQFTVSAKIVPLFTKTGTVAASDVGGTFAITPNLSLRSDNIVSGTQQGYFGGLQYFISSKGVLAKTNFDPSTFQFYLAASGGLIHNGTTQRPGLLAKGGVNFDPTHKGKFTVNLIEAGVVSGSIVNSPGVKPIISGGLSLGW
jgi:hypothetical protein